MFSRKNKNISALSAVIFATLLFGTNAVALKMAVATMDPLLFVSLRFFATGLILFLFIKSFAFIKNPQAMWGMALNTLLITVFVATHALGVAASGALKASILSLIAPVMVYVFSVFLLHEPIIKRVMTGGLVALLGSLLLIGLPAVTGQSIAGGDVLLMVAYTALAASIVHAKYMYKWLTPNQVLSIRFSLTGLFLLLYVVIVSGLSTIPTGDVLAWSLLLYGIVVTGVIGNSLYYRALKKIRAEDAAPIFYLDPMVGALGAALLLGERLDISALIGMGIIVFGVLLAHPHHYRLLHHYHVHTSHRPLGILKRFVNLIGR